MTNERIENLRRILEEAYKPDESKDFEFAYLLGSIDGIMAVLGKLEGGDVVKH
ncbi:hypothetical protein [Sphingomonas sanguinis]|uniref:hypothetical protein n=1 Tax=Sphingomonas sanguinis TaxID=33051 RepID=UPI00187BD893|nr:hypothetical protein [Sphingomonas sanguinis]